MLAHGLPNLLYQKGDGQGASIHFIWQHSTRQMLPMNSTVYTPVMMGPLCLPMFCSLQTRGALSNWKIQQWANTAGTPGNSFQQGLVDNFWEHKTKFLIAIIGQPVSMSDAKLIKIHQYKLKH